MKRKSGTFPLAPIVLIVSCTILSFAAAGTMSTPPRGRKLFKNHRLMIALARARGEKDVMLVMAAQPGGNAAVAAEVERRGGRVRFRADDLDYLRAIVPLGQLERLAELPQLEGLDIDIHAMSFYPPNQFPLPKEEPSNNPPDPDTPYSHPYIASADMDTAAFWAQNPTYDGRGVGLAILDATPDILHAEFSSATSLNGDPTRKIPEILSVTDPVDDHDPMWVKMDVQIRAENGEFSYNNTTYKTPADGQFRLGFFDERALEEPAYLHKDVNFDGNPDGSSGLFAVLWDEKTNTVWVDTNQNHNFADEKPMTDYVRRFDVGLFGKSAPVNGRRKSVAFIIQTDAANKYVRVSLCTWQHVTMVAGAAVGKGFYGGTYNGVAPEAQLIPVYYPGGINRIIEAAIAAAKSDKVDVICLEPNVLDATINPLHDGRAVPAIIFDRIIEKYKKPILSPANNEPGVTTVLDYLSGDKVIAVGAYQSDTSYRINDGAVVTNHDNLHLVGSYGPAGDGGLKPEIISPSEIISVDAGFKPPERRKGIYELPPGYAIAGGTSTAGPTASAATALLISAARQAGVKYDADRLRQALISGAKFIPNIPAYKQGNGLVQVGASWEILKEMDKRYDPVTIVSRAPVRTATSDYLASPNEGRGIFEREGWQPGQSRERTITFTRKSGSPEPITFTLEWIGNDGTFASADSITLPLNTPVALPVEIATRSAGIHSSILNLRRPGYPGIAYQTLNTVIAAEDFNATNSYTLEKKAQVERPGTLSFFVRVPPNTPAMSLDLVIPNAKPTIRALALDPCRSARLLFGTLGATEKGRLSKVIANPQPGVWEILLFGNNFRFKPEEIDSTPLAPVPVTLRASLVGVDASPSELRLTRWPDESTREIVFRNRLAPFRGGALSIELGSSRRTMESIAPGQAQIHEVELPAGTRMLRASIGHLSDPRGDLAIYLFQEVEGVAYLKDFDDEGSETKNVVAYDPKPGKWKIAVSASESLSSAVEYAYEDTILHPLFGRVAVEDPVAVRNSSSTWKGKAQFKVTAVPSDGRSLVGYIPIYSLPESDQPSPATALESEKSPMVPVGLATAFIRTPINSASAGRHAVTRRLLVSERNKN